MVPRCSASSGTATGSRREVNRDVAPVDLSLCRQAALVLTDGALPRPWVATQAEQRMRSAGEGPARTLEAAKFARARRSTSARCRTIRHRREELRRGDTRSTRANPPTGPREPRRTLGSEPPPGKGRRLSQLPPLCRVPLTTPRTPEGLPSPRELQHDITATDADRRRELPLCHLRHIIHVGRARIIES